MSGSSMLDLHWEHPWEVHIYSTPHSACWPPCTSPSTGFFEGHRLCGGSSKHIFILFPWNDLRLLRDAVFELISLCHCILYHAVMTGVSQYIYIKKKARTSAQSQCHDPDRVSHTCELPLPPPFHQWMYPTLVVYSNCHFIIRLHCVWSHGEDQTRNGVTLTCWISGDHVSISQPLLSAHLRSSEKDKGWGNEMIQRGAHSRVDIKNWIQMSFGTALPKLELSWVTA